MPRNILILTFILVFVILVVGVFVVDYLSPRPFALVMQKCGGELSLEGSHITWYASIEAAKDAGDSRLHEDYDLASIYEPPAKDIFNPLLWIKTTNLLCYDGDYMDWTAIVPNQG